jgi:hypothetical protein
MRQALLIASLTLLLPLSVRAQETPKVEVFGGYLYASIEAGQERVNTNGWHAMIAINTKYPGLEFVADVTGHYGSLARVGVDTHTALFGVRSSLRREKVTGFVHSLYGVSRIDADADMLGGSIKGRSDVAFAFVPGGGGLDIKLSDTLAFRVFQFDLLVTHWGRNDSQLHLRLSSGIVFRFGQR